MADDWSFTPDPATTLGEVRRRVGRSQAEIASRIGTTQSGVSRLERQGDIKVSTLNEYISALGGRLRLCVELDGGRLDLALPANRPDPARSPREFRVIWQAPTVGNLVHVGWLEYTGDDFVFSYTDDARNNPEFEPFPSFPRLDATYRSHELFPYFAVRLVSAADPSFGILLNALGLARDEATPAELLSRGPTGSPHDTIQVVPEPTELPDGNLARLFLVSGVRHVAVAPSKLDRWIGSLRPGDSLSLVPDPDNDFNRQALKVTAGGQDLGWIPDYLLDEVHEYLASDRLLGITVERANGPDAPWHLRLLCRLLLAPA